MEKRKPGRPEGKSYPVQVNTYMTLEMQARVKRQATARGQSIGAAVREALRQWLGWPVNGKQGDDGARQDSRAGRAGRRGKPAGPDRETV